MVSVLKEKKKSNTNTYDFVIHPPWQGKNTFFSFEGNNLQQDRSGVPSWSFVFFLFSLLFLKVKLPKNVRIFKEHYFLVSHHNNIKHHYEERERKKASSRIERWRGGGE